MLCQEHILHSNIPPLSTTTLKCIAARQTVLIERKLPMTSYKHFVNQSFLYGEVHLILRLVDFKLAFAFVVNTSPVLQSMYGLYLSANEVQGHHSHPLEINENLLHTLRLHSCINVLGDCEPGAYSSSVEHNLASWANIHGVDTEHMVTPLQHDNFSCGHWEHT